jgi:acyl-CoA synthetase (AMP-forming)/AMP-acid ligase II
MISLYELVIENSRRHPDKIALWQVGGGDPISTTYGELADLAVRSANTLDSTLPEAGMLPVFANKSAESVAAMLACLATGRVFAFLNLKLRAPQIELIMKLSGAQFGIMDGPRAMALRGGLGEDSLITDATWWITGETSGPFSKALKRLPKRQDFSEILSKTGADLPAPDPSKPGCCLFTSGSTGSPKGVLIGAGDLAARARSEVEAYGLDENDVLLSILPFSFDVGLNQMMSSLSTGATLVMLDSWLPADILKTAANFKVTGISGVPAIWMDMMNAGLSFDGESTNLRYITVSGGDLAERDLRRLPDFAPGAGIFKTYGQTEAFRASMLKPDEFATHSADVGRAYADVKLYVVDEEGQPCPPGETGEILHGGLGTMLGYLSAKNSDSKLRPNPFFGEDDPNKRIIFTGDMGSLDTDGYLSLAGRKDGMLKVMGNRIYPAEIIGQILEIDGVADAQVLGIKGEDGETTLVAFVVALAGVEFEPKKIRRELNGRLPAYMVPQHVEILPVMPRTGTNKPDLKALRERAARFIN